MNQKINLEGYVDLEAGNAIDRKSTSGCFFNMGSGVISWFSRKKSYVELSTAGAEYVASCSASCEAVWLRKILSDIFDLNILQLIMDHWFLSQLHTALVVIVYTSSIHLEIKQIK